MSSHEHQHESIPARPMSRRNLLKALAASTVAVGVGATLGPTAASALGGVAAAPSSGRSRLVPVNRIGIQLYTVRDKVSSLGFRAVFEELADIGYPRSSSPGTRRADRCDHPAGDPPAARRQRPAGRGRARQPQPDQHRRRDREGADPRHAPPGPGRADQQHQYGRRVDGRGADLERHGVKAEAAGLKLYAHNHDGEFRFTSDDPSRRVYDLLWDEFDPDLVYFEMDVYWAHVGQHKYPGSSPSSTSSATRDASRCSTSRTGRPTRPARTATTSSSSAQAASTTSPSCRSCASAASTSACTSRTTRARSPSRRTPELAGQRTTQLHLHLRPSRLIPETTGEST
ncbi:twin-arginine translocation signal domain-containing protein [Oerskovia sp. M15]